MNGEERQLITGLFDRMRGVGAIDKDRDAEALINQSVRQIPDAPYMLVQSVLVQEQALQQAGARIEELEARVRELEQQSYRQQPAQSSGGFLGGLFGGGAAARPAPQPMARGSVPSVASGRPMGAPAGSTWGNAPGYGQPGQPGYAPQPQAQGGGFMKSALATAAGVAGGMLVAGAISNMLKGDQAHASGAQQPAPAQDAANDPGYDSNDPGTMEAADDGNDPGWDSGDAGDMDI